MNEKLRSHSFDDRRLPPTLLFRFGSRLLHEFTTRQQKSELWKFRKPTSTKRSVTRVGAHSIRCLLVLVCNLLAMFSWMKLFLQTTNLNLGSRMNENRFNVLDIASNRFHHARIRFQRQEVELHRHMVHICLSNSPKPETVTHNRPTFEWSS